MGSKLLCVVDRKALEAKEKCTCLPCASMERVLEGSVDGEKEGLCIGVFVIGSSGLGFECCLV